MDPLIPTATAATRARRIIRLFDVILEIGFINMIPVTISLCGNQNFSSLIGVAYCKRGLPVEDKGIGRVQQTEEANAVDDRLCND